ncbi:MAG: hypothetical protein HOH43_00175 [Candidatus Latescibacteria bacterium]|nr:hypothetical protein [Candidatus Latescibacterota bacterium]
MYRLFTTLLTGLSILGCEGIDPDTRSGSIVDASRNIASVSYHQVARPDNPFPVESVVFARHFLYVNQSTPWTILSSGIGGAEPRFEEGVVYLLRLRPNEQPVRLIQVPGVQTAGVSPPRLRLVVAAPSVVLLDGVLQTRNVSGKALVHLEDGPLYGGFTVDVPDTVEVADQFPTLLSRARVRVAALAFDGATAAYVDVAGRLYTLDLVARTPPILVTDLRAFLGPSDISGMQWPVGSDESILLKIDRGIGAESWSVRMVDGQIAPATADPGQIGEPGSDRLELIDQLTRELPAGIWRVPAPSRFE